MNTDLLFRPPSIAVVFGVGFLVFEVPHLLQFNICLHVASLFVCVPLLMLFKSDCFSIMRAFEKTTQPQVLLCLFRQDVGLVRPHHVPLFSPYLNHGFWYSKRKHQKLHLHLGLVNTSVNIDSCQQDVGLVHPPSFAVVFVVDFLVFQVPHLLQLLP